MNLQGNINIKRVVVLLLTLSFFMNSCKKGAEEEQVIIQEGAAKVIINLIGTADTVEPLQVSKVGNAARFASVGASADRTTGQDAYKEETQEQVVQLNDGLIVTATLVPEAEPVKTVSAVKGKVMAAGKTMAAGDAVRNVLGTGVQYKVIAYNLDGSFKAEQNYSYGSTETTVGLALDSEVEYTFVVYSVNSTTVLPTVTGTTLTTATLTGVTGDLMYFQKRMKVTAGNNYLDVILRHKFSQITTNIEYTAETRGNLISINSTAFKDTRTNADFKLSDSVITYGLVKAGGTAAQFPTIPAAGVRSISSSPTLLISPATTTATFSIGATSSTANVATGSGADAIGNTSRTNNTILSGFKINPGRKYNLNLKFAIPCTENVSVGTDFNWSGGPNTRTILAPAADFGFVFDIMALDNSFNMTINGTRLLTHPTNTNNEVQFEGSITGRPKNIRFADGTEYGTTNADEIWSVAGDAVRPALRLVISADGKVSMYGKKKTGAQLEPLALYGDFKFNDVTWNTAAPNTVVISQHVQNVTTLKGTGYGQKIVPCP